MKYIFLVLFFFASVLIYAQKKEIDSLELEIKLHKVEDTIKLKLLTELAFYYVTFDAKRGKELADSALLLAKKFKMPILTGLAYQNKARNQYSLGNYRAAMNSNKRAIDFFKKENESFKIAKANFEFGKIYIQTSQLDSSAIYLKKALTVFETEKDSLEMAITQNVLGVNLLFQADYKKSLQCFLESTTLFNKLNLTQTSDYASLQSNFAMYYYNIRDYQNALIHYSRASEIFKKVNEPSSYGNVLTNIGNIYSGTNQPNLALEYYKEAYDAFKISNYSKGKANTLVNIGIIHFHLKEYNKANDLFLKALPLFKEWDDNKSISSIYHSLGRVQLGLFKSNSSKNHLISAQEYFNFADSIGKRAADPLRVVYSNTFSAEVNKLLGKEAYAKDQVIEAYKVRDSLLSNQIMRELTQIEQKYRLEIEKDSINAENNRKQELAKVEIKKQKELKKAYGIAGVFIFLTSVIGVFLYRRKNQAIVAEKKAEYEAKVATTELKALRAQMNPHFIFNSLNSIDNYLQKNDKKSSGEYLRKFAKLMRKTLENSEREEILLSEDLELLRTYLEIELKRIPNKFRYQFEIDQDVDIENVLVPPLILQPFIENSIWHGMTDKNEDGMIIVKVEKQGNFLLYIVDDNGLGRDKNKVVNKKKSMGIELTKNRIALINSSFNVNHCVKFIDKIQGLRVELKFPLNLLF